MTLVVVESPRGKTVALHVRENTCDLSIVGGTFRLWGKLDDEYGLADLYPKTFLDIGGHIGTVTVAVLVDNPECRAVILEPLPENIEAIYQNLNESGLADRATVVEGAIGDGFETRIGYRLPRTEAAQDTDQFVGAPVADDYAGEAVTVRTHSVSQLLSYLGQKREGDTIDLAKIDCEGCEWTALADKAARRVDRWVGEYHPGGGSIAKHLGRGYKVALAPHASGGTGNFSAVRR